MRGLYSNNFKLLEDKMISCLRYLVRMCIKFNKNRNFVKIRISLIDLCITDMVTEINFKNS